MAKRRFPRLNPVFRSTGLQTPTCYDHMAGTVAVGLHDYMAQHHWLEPLGQDGSDYQLSTEGAAALERLGLDVEKAGRARRRFACACLDWSERRPHLGGALGAALLALLLRQGWIELSTSI